MAYATKDSKGWVAVFRPLGAVRGRHRLRIPPKRWRGMDDEERAADAHALACEAACRQLEQKGYTHTDIRRALELGAISPDQGEALLTGRPAPARITVKPMTLEEAALAHPSSAYDKGKKRRWGYLAHLKDFERFAGVTHVQDLTLDQVQRYIAHRRAAGDAWDTRRHKLLYIRRAARMGNALRGLADPISGFRLDRAEERAPIQVYELEQLAKAAVVFERAKDMRALVALALGGFVGLRPSEVFRVTCGDVDKSGVLRTGRKNAASRRQLPLPAIVARWVKQLVDDRQPEAPLVAAFPGWEPRTGPRRQGKPFNEVTFSKWLAPKLAEATGQRLPVKVLRKSFATWMVRSQMEIQHVEAYLGHRSSLVQRVTARHYLGAWLIEALRPTAAKIDAMVIEAMKAVTPVDELQVDIPKPTPKQELHAES